MLAFERSGTGPALVLIHGLGATGEIWTPVISRLAEERDVVTVDLPGFGRSDPLPAGTRATAANMAGAVAELCTALGLERPHLAGNSLGGWTALEGGRAGRAASVTVLSPAGLWGRPLGPRTRSFRPVAMKLRPLISLLLRSKRVRRAALASSFGYPDRVPVDAARHTILSWVDSRSYDAANEEMRTGLFDPAGYPPIPVTIAWGELDRLVAPPKRERRPADARFLVLPDVGHTPTWDDPDLIARVLLEGSSGA